ncbi:MAG: hypothetical protein Q8O62_10595 [Aequorivita sp.]|nr:hypothetical protein [Aequorivita sp.]
MKTILILKSLFICTIILYSCNKKDDDNQCAKTENYLEATFDGGTIEPQYLVGGGIGGYTLYATRNEENKADWNITVLSENNISFYLTILNIQETGTYQFETASEDDLPPPPISYLKTYIFLDENVEGPLSYYFSIENTGSIEVIEYNEEVGILVGTFSCNLYNSFNPDIVKRISGEFNINLSTLNIDEKPCWL